VIRETATRPQSAKIQFHSILFLGTNVHQRHVFRVDNTAATFSFFQESYNTFQKKRHLRDWRKWIDSREGEKEGGREREREMNQKMARQISFRNRAPTNQLSRQKRPRVWGVFKTHLQHHWMVSVAHSVYLTHGRQQQHYHIYDLMNKQIRLDLIFVPLHWS